MPLSLIIENETSLPDGGPLSFTTSGTRGLDIGRDQYLDWTLPDPSRAISGRHCEVRWRDGGYWLHDVSRNGTFVNQTVHRLQEPHCLRAGDRLYIGHFIIRVEIDGESPRTAASAPERSRDHDLQDPWSASDDAAPQISRADLRPADHRSARADYSEWQMDLPPTPVASGFAPVPEPRPDRAPVDSPPWVAPPTGSGSPWSDPPSRRGGISAPPGDNPWGAPTLGTEPLQRAAPSPPPSAPPFENAMAPLSGIERSASTLGAHAGVDSFVQRFAKGAGVPADLFDWRDPGDFAEDLGALTRLSIENLKQLLAARAETKRAARAANQTMIQALDNNPLKFTPTVEDALRILFGRPTSGYLPPRRAMEDGFRDLKAHQVKVYAAMQHAVRLLLQDLDPDAIEASLGDDRGLNALLGSRKARLWDLYATRWDTMTAAHDDGMEDAFMRFFSECYDSGDT
ncbi:type VI secretion system-associated FHA domain protein TagH [Methylobacterium sp. 285MFTsu5.1]|uniref:type VI secretion system-associated FHA domain protein TagH n=1 Tax=Methylobacterium sp. 285MFTsu5.1 TaxID=1172187 RepID=UPI00047AE11D|nr:type VI secretion system-associated FHA domain protein TagH [Methylobacterium sp. 285MFTsu5.1]